MVFDPKTQGLKCPYCATVQILEGEAKTAEIALSDALLASQNWVEETTVFECTNCSARVVLESGETAKNCPFCGTTNVVPSKELSGVKPNGVLPFTLVAEEANQKAKRWAKKKLFAPRKFKKQNAESKNSQHVIASAFAFLSKQKRQRQNNTYTQTQREYMRKLPLSTILVACWMNAKKPITKAHISPPLYTSFNLSCPCENHTRQANSHNQPKEIRTQTALLCRHTVRLSLCIIITPIFHIVKYFYYICHIK
jgi:DNA-directed RNA polymerase subunit RPC12/RpoP